MKSLNKAQKLVKMVELMNRRGGVRSSEFMERFDVDARTLRRYLSDLREMEMPLIDTGMGESRTISLDPNYRRSGVQLSLPEVLSLHFGRTLFTFLEGTQFAEDLQGAIERLEPAIPRAHADLAKDLDRKFMAVPEHAKDYREVGELIDDLITALLYENPVTATYVKADGSSRDYDLEPWTLATYRQGLYLFAKDRRDGRVKTFAVERFTRFDRVRHDKFVLPADFDPKAVVSSAFGIIGGPLAEVSLVFDAIAAPFVMERRWHHSAHLSRLPDGSARLQMRVAITQELVTWILGYGGSVSIEGPLDLRASVLAAHEAAVTRLRAGA